MKAMMPKFGKRRRNAEKAVVGNEDIVQREESDEKTRSYRSKRGNLLYLRLQNQWFLRSRPTRFLFSIFSIAVTFQVIISIYDRMFYAFDGSNQLEIGEHFAVVINTYKRPGRLRNAVQHYASTCGKQAGVGQVFIVWAEQTANIPTLESFFGPNLRDSDKSIQNRAHVKVLQKSKDSLNSRFEPIEALKDDAVFMVDDDILVDCPSLTSGFNAWRKHPLGMVGYYPRLASPPLSDPSSEELVYHTWPIVYLRHKFNFVLTKASFLHAKYLELYTSDEFPQKVRDYVDKHMNCEDIAMSMLVANFTKYSAGQPEYPIYVEGNVDDRGLFGGISTGSGHMATRSDCVTTLTKIFEEKGWGAPLAYDIPLRDNSWIHHAPGFWWQHKPSNFFEWISFANMLT